jgi:hypothetical protein
MFIVINVELGQKRERLVFGGVVLVGFDMFVGHVQFGRSNSSNNGLNNIPIGEKRIAFGTE